MEKTKDIKKIGHFQIRFTTSFNKKESDDISLKVLITEDLRKFIKENVVISELVSAEYVNGGEYTQFERYKVRSFWFSCLTRNKEQIFHKDLIDKGKAEFCLKTKDSIEDAIHYFKENFNLLIKNVMKYNNIDITITYN